MKADVGEKRFARKPLCKRVQGEAAKQRNLVGPKRRGAGGRVREGREPMFGGSVGFCARQCLKAGVGEKRYAREPLRKRVQGDAAKQHNLVGPKQRGAGGRVREGREPRFGEPVVFCEANV